MILLTMLLLLMLMMILGMEVMRKETVAVIVLVMDKNSFSPQISNHCSSV